MIISSTAVHIYMIFIYLQSLKGSFRSVMIFSISIDPLKSLLTVRRKFFTKTMLLFILEVFEVLHELSTLVTVTTSFCLTSITEKSIGRDRSVLKKRIAMSTNAYKSKR